MSNFMKLTLPEVVDFVAAAVSEKLRYAPSRRCFERFNGGTWQVDGGGDISDELIRLASYRQKAHVGQAGREAIWLCSEPLYSAVRSRLKVLLSTEASS